MTVLASVTDPDGRFIELTAERWAHVVDIHPEVEHLQDAVLRAVATPDHRRAGPRPNERWYYLEGVGPSRWLKVVVAFTDERGWIVRRYHIRQRQLRR